MIASEYEEKCTYMDVLLKMTPAYQDMNPKFHSLKKYCLLSASSPFEQVR